MQASPSSSAVATEHGTDPPIRLQKSQKQTCVSRPRAHNSCKLDIGIGIRVFVHCKKAGHEVEYYGEFFNQGQFKTVFELQNESEVFHGKILKVAREKNIEPDVWPSQSNDVHFIQTPSAMMEKSSIIAG